MCEEQKTPHQSAAATSEESRKFNELYSLVYEDLRRIASSLLRKEEHATICSTALVNESWLRLRDAPELAATSHTHFSAIAAQVMRRFLMDDARRRKAEKRGGPSAIRVTIDESVLSLPGENQSAQLLDLDRALDRLAALSKQQCQIAEHRLFSDLTNPEIAAELSISLSTVERGWRVGRAFLIKELGLRSK
jgi:RNA polymerase sigma factor (TIGR02999 family)